MQNRSTSPSPLVTALLALVGALLAVIVWLVARPAPAPPSPAPSPQASGASRRPAPFAGGAVPRSLPGQVPGYPATVPGQSFPASPGAPPASPPVSRLDVPRASGSGYVPSGARSASRSASSPQDLDRFLQWVRYVEAERMTFRTQTVAYYRQLAQVQTALSSPAMRSANPALVHRYEAQRDALLTQSRSVTTRFRQSFQRTRPTVPLELSSVNSAYRRAIDAEYLHASQMFQAARRADVPRLLRIRREGAEIDRHLMDADGALVLFFRSRGVQPQVRVARGAPTVP